MIEKTERRLEILRKTAWWGTEMKISVIVPFYNMEAFAARAVSSLKNQDEPNVEFILVNDGSTDNTLSILQNLCAKDERFQILNIEENQGYGRAVNVGIQQSKGDFWGIFEPDDVLPPDFYSTLLKSANTFQQADVIRYNGIFCEEKGFSKRLYHWEEEFAGKVLDKYALKRFWHSHPSVFNGIYRKSFTLQKSVFFCETPGASFQDAMFMVSLFYANPSILIINEVKYRYTLHSGQSIAFANEKVDVVIQNWEKEKEWIGANAFKDFEFFLYKVFIQMESLLKKVSPENQKKLLKAFKTFTHGKVYLHNPIPTGKQKMKYALRVLRKEQV